MKKLFKEWQVKLMLHKHYFDNGYGLTSPIKWLAAIAGISNAFIKKS